MLTVAEMAGMIDHSILHPSTTDADLVKGIEIAKRYRTICVVPKIYQIPRAKELLGDSPVRLCAPIGFPQGLNPTPIKAAEAEWAAQHGAVEMDMVLNISALKSKQYDYVAQDIAAVLAATRRAHAPLKVILETCLLTDEEIVAGCQIAVRAGAQFVKTSTQTQPGGATVEAIRLMCAVVTDAAVVKASGYITDIDKTLALYEAGARRFGTGYTEAILEGLRAKRLAAGESDE
jgi:deoxyribose-phosphate aldolase